MSYKDLREFIAEVEKVDTLRHVRGAQTHLEIGGITEVAAGLPECPALLFDDIPGFPRGFRIFTNPVNTPQRAALALGLDPKLRPSTRSRPGWRSARSSPRASRCSSKRPRSWRTATWVTRWTSASFPVPVWHQQGWRPLYRLGQHRRDARPGHRLDQCVDLSGAGARQEPGHRSVRSSRAATAPSSPRNIGTVASLARSRS